jgi:hypothetical protein
MTAQLFAHGRSTAGLASSTYKLMLDLSLGADPVSSNLRATLTAVVLAPAGPTAGDLRTLSPQQATSLCGRSVDWIEIVSGAA